MSVLLHMYSDFDGLRIETQSDDADTIWIRGRNSTVSLTLSAEDRAKLRAALDEPQQAAA